MSPLHTAAQNGTLTASQLTQHDPRLIDSLSNGLTPLITAVLHSQLDTIHLLIQHGADVDALDANGRTALSVAAEKVWANQPLVIRALLSAKPPPKVDATCRAVSNNTPLMLVIQQSRNIDVIRQLIDAGASLDAENDPVSEPGAKKSTRSRKKAARGSSVFQLAQATKEPEVVYVLRKKYWGGGARAEVITRLIGVVVFVLQLVNQPLESGHRLLSELLGWNGPPEETGMPEIPSDKPKQNPIPRTPAPDNTPDTAPDPGAEKEQPAHPTPGNDNPPDTPPDHASPLSPEELTQQEIEQQLQDIKAYVDKTGLNDCFALDDDNFLQTIAEKAVLLRQDASTLLGSKEYLPDMIDLAMFKVVIYCDDSGSMRKREGGEKRFDLLVNVVQRVARIATKLVPDHMGVDLQFINSEKKFKNLHDEDEIKGAMEEVEPNGGTLLGKGLKNRIVGPMIHHVLDSKERLKRPLLVTIITDGRPDDKKAESLQNVIKECRRKLDEKRYPDYAAIFQISQVGSDGKAKEFLNGLINSDEDKEIVYCTSGHLDKKYQSMRNNEKALEVWLLKHLIGPIQRWGSDDFVH